MKHHGVIASLKHGFIAAAVFGIGFAFSTLSFSQVPSSPITSSGLNTHVSGPTVLPNASTQYNITGGTRPGGGTNLFHSFGDFGVPANNVANFLNETALPTTNILGRVTGGNPSNIFGTIQTTGFGNANLFLMNPAGMVFGPNASLNVGGSVSFATADYLRLADGAQFHAIPGLQDASISSAPVAAFGFLGSSPGAITVQGGQLAVQEGQGISLVGGNIEITAGTFESATTQPARLSARGGQINMASVASPGEVLVSTFIPDTGMALGSIMLAQGSLLDVSSDAAGTVRIRGGQFILDNSTISADTINGNGAQIAVDINVTNRLSISANQIPAITARATGDGNAGEVRLRSGETDVNFAFPEFGIVIDSSTAGAGNAGKVTLTTDKLTAVNSDPTAFGVLIDSGTGGAGNGGDVTINVRDADLQFASINTGDAFLFGSGSAGNLRIGGHNGTADSLRFETLVLSTEAFSAKAGAIILEARDIRITDNTFVSSISLFGENPITINADRLSMDNVVRVQAQTMGTGNGGDIVFTGNRLDMSNESAFITQTLGDGNAGTIRVNASDHVRLADNPLVSTPSGLFTNSLGSTDVTTSGDAGAIHLNTPRLEMTGGARLSTTTQTAGRGGEVTVVASEGVLLSGQRIGGPPLENFGLGGSDGSGIFTRSIETPQCGGTCGGAGDQVINTGRLVLSNGGVLDSGTTGNGSGGNIQVNAANEIAVSGALADGTPSGIFSRTVGTTPSSGTGGNISLAAGQSVSIGNGAAISASSTGPANAGNIIINAGAQFLSQNGAITTQANQASGGNITIQATDAIRLVNSQLSTSVQGGPNTVGGNILLDPAVVTLQNSQVTAQALDGQGGNINIVAGTFLADQTSLVSASSQFGLSGTVNIQSPVSSLSNTLATLTQRPLQAQNLLRQRCAAQVNGQLSSLVVSGRDALPVEPGGWLMSPLALMADDESAPQAHVASKLVFEGHFVQSSDHHDSIAQRGVWDRETGCGS